MHPNPNPTYDLHHPALNILHALSSTFATCACGARAKDCALTQMAACIDAQDKYLSTHARTLVNSQTQPNGVKEDWRENDWREVDLGPLVGRLKTRQRIPFSGGMEMEVEPAAGEAERRGRSGGVNGHTKSNGFVDGRKTPPPPLSNILF
jgi:hypothetical protein